MASTLRFVGWSPGLNKVALTKLIRQHCGLSLDKAHDIVNRVLNNEIVEVAIPSENAAQELAEAARKLGAQAEPVETELRRTGTYG